MSERGGDWSTVERIFGELNAVYEKEQVARKAWLDYAFGGRSPEDPALVGKLAYYIANSQGEGVTEESYRLARTLRAHIERRQELMKVMKAEIAYEHPEWLEDLNAEKSLEELEQMFGIQGEEEPPETP